MAVDPVTAGLGAASLISGKSAQKKASKQAASAQNLERMMAQRAAKLFDVLMGKAEEFEAQGGFDPDARFDEMRKTVDREYDMAASRLGGDLRIAGGKPGERAVVSRLAGLRGKQVEALTRLKDQLKQESFFNKLQAFSAANPGAPLGAANVFGRQADRAYGQMPDPTAFFQSMMPFMRQNQGQTRNPRNLMIGGGYMGSQST